MISPRSSGAPRKYFPTPTFLLLTMTAFHSRDVEEETDTAKDLKARVDHLMTAETTNHINIQDLIVSVKDLMTAETTNTKTIQDLTTRVDHLKTAETANENTIQILTAHVDHLKTAENTNNKTIPDLKARVDHLMTAETANHITIQDLTTRVDKLDGMSDKRKVWFAAVGGNTKTCDGKVMFGNVRTNMGNAYDANTGIFTAPYKGAYFFTLNYLSVGKRINLRVYKEKDGNRERLMDVYDDTNITGKYYMASSSRMVDLEDGEKVYINADSDDELTNYWSNVFSGFLLHPM
ncbi:uncharacterized protein LOC129185760 [Dunckerocampus dactyliophorus]|uniref:uncharacterized protein LOC129185760 n=1 Tax=Dunckerocampus dactyliophorus TaxID=161453 RepID=UPI002405A838|nr:uncharacterized protein LOC129185760 [Dunckerocampus dactyliophorus]